MPICHRFSLPQVVLPAPADPQTRFEHPSSGDAEDILQEEAGREVGDAYPIRLR